MTIKGWIVYLIVICFVIFSSLARSNASEIPTGLRGKFNLDSPYSITPLKDFSTPFFF